MKSSLFYMIALFITGCSKQAHYNTELLKQRTGGAERGIIISCTRCNCVTAGLKFYREYLEGIPFFGSWSCLSKKDSFAINDLPEASLDSIYEKNYNIILFRRSSSYNYKFRLIKTEEAQNMMGIIERFFDLPDQSSLLSK